MSKSGVLKQISEKNKEIQESFRTKVTFFVPRKYEKPNMEATTKQQSLENQLSEKNGYWYDILDE
jgi:hypothetical protein